MATFLVVLTLYSCAILKATLRRAFGPPGGAYEV